MSRINSPAELEEFRNAILAKRDPKKPCIAICAGAGCIASGAGEVIEAFRAEIEKQGIDAAVDIKGTGCPGFCERGPVVVIHPEEICYLQVKPEDVPEILGETIQNNKVVERLLYEDPNTGEKAVHETDIPFYGNQVRNLICNNIKIDSKSLEDYLAIGGYSALSKALTEMSDEDVLQEVKKSNLRGRGGGGFPAGRKWEGSKAAEEPIKYVIVNADEGDPGAFMDRALLEGNPHSVLEGMIIGAYAIGAQPGIHLRAETNIPPGSAPTSTIAIKRGQGAGPSGRRTSWAPISDFVVTMHARRPGRSSAASPPPCSTAIEGQKSACPEAQVRPRHRSRASGTRPTNVEQRGDLGQRTR